SYNKPHRASRCYRGRLYVDFTLFQTLYQCKSNKERAIGRTFYSELCSISRLTSIKNIETLPFRGDVSMFLSVEQGAFSRRESYNVRIF
ncbi:MAG: hypothetical protein NC201_02935, partial [Prevotella sp.]|nr:hypothetical protein [Prevotella sp.]MCM1436754.1 hypothetical protein [Prevotella sp.]